VTPNPPDVPQAKYFSGAGGLQSTAHDYLLFEQMLVNRGELNGKRLLAPRTVELMGSNLIGDLYRSPGGGVPGLGFGVTVEVIVDSPVARSGLSNGGFGWSGAFGTRTWNDRAEEIAGVLMMQQRSIEHLYDYEMAVRQAIVD
jgi:CubicO group peptidase (beta-lactamase class C family)